MTANKPLTWERIKRYTNSGALFTSDGNSFQFADFLKIKNIFDSDSALYSSHNIAILSIRLENLLPQVDHYFVIDIPTNKKFILSERLLNLSEGRYFIDAVAVGTFNQTGTTEGATAGMDKTKPLICDTRLRYAPAANITSPVIREYGFLDTGTAQTGQARAQGSTGSERNSKILQGPSCLRINKTNINNFTCNCLYWLGSRHYLRM